LEEEFMKKVLFILLCVLMVGIPLFAKGGADTSKTIAYCLPHKNTEFMVTLAGALQKEITAAGYTYTEYVADNDGGKQLTQVEQAIQRKVAGIILDALDPEALGPGVTAAKKAGIPLVTVHEGVNNNDAVSYIGPDFADGGKQKMQAAMQDLPNGGNIAFMYGPQGHPAQIAISSGYPLALAGQEAKYPVVFSANGDWSAESALDTVSSWLSSGQRIDAIVSDNDGMAMGIIQAVQAAGKTGEIKVYGLDAEPRVLQEIKKGTITATVKVDIDGEAKHSVDFVLKSINKQPVPSQQMLPMVLINAKNVDQYL
jgi:ABC-type sugar transport system substrate-binding protein